MGKIPFSYVKEGGTHDDHCDFMSYTHTHKDDGNCNNTGYGLWTSYTLPQEVQHLHRPRNKQLVHDSNNVACKASHHS